MGKAHRWGVPKMQGWAQPPPDNQHVLLLKDRKQQEEPKKKPEGICK